MSKFPQKGCLLIFLLNKDYTAQLLNLKGIMITNIENISVAVRTYLELPRIKRACPAYGVLSDRTYDYRMQTVKNIPLGRKTLLYLRKRRYRYPCGNRSEIFQIRFH